MQHPETTTSRLLPAILILALGPWALADAYDPPAGYYSTATGTTAGLLESQIHDIIDGHIWRSYDDARVALQILDADPSNSANMILIYNAQSVTQEWDGGQTWNREHTWPRSRGVDSSGPDSSDYHMLRPCNSSVNSSRGNEPFGTLSSSYWDPNALGGDDRGEIARTQFYAAVRYDGSDANTVDLELVDGFPSGNQMGDLAELMEWHFAYPPDQQERRRNHVVWSSDPADWDDPDVLPSPFVLNQGNRNPFVDRPEFAWVIWGSGPNNATLFVGASPMADGSSTLALDLGRVIEGAALGASVPIEKSGDHPAAYRVSVTGDAASSDAGLPLSYPFTPAPAGVGQPMLDVSVSVSGPGAYAGDVVIDNVQLTSAGTGTGSDDADDVVSVTATVVASSNASFEDPADTDSITIDFGSVTQNAPDPQLPFAVHNLSGSFVADLDLDSITPSGDSAVLTTDLAPFTNLASGDSASFQATLDTGAVPGAYGATYTLTLSDEDIPGEVAGQVLTLTLNATIVPPACVADLDGDGDTDVFDFGIFAANFGAGPGATHDQGDLNADGFVDVFDFGILGPDFGCVP